MNRMREIIEHGEEGHGMPLIGTLIGAVGAILLAIGAANDTGALAIVGGIVLAVGLFATLVIQHMTVEWGIFGRLENLEKK
jgi:tetrahydromethanopterin S-methyltransferase subunit D